MLILSRKEHERIHIGDDVVVVVRKIKGATVSLAIEAPRDREVLRGELHDKEKRP